MQNDSELFGRTLRVNIAKPLRIKENATRPVWADEEWLQTYSGTEKIANAEPTGGTEELENQKNAKLKRQGQEAVEIAGVRILFLICNYRKVASSRPVYYSIFDHFWGATNQDVLLTEMCYYCYVQKPIK